MLEYLHFDHFQVIARHRSGSLISQCQLLIECINLHLERCQLIASKYASTKRTIEILEIRRGENSFTR